MKAEAGFLSIEGRLCMQTFIGLEAVASKHYKIWVHLANFTPSYFLEDKD